VHPFSIAVAFEDSIHLHKTDNENNNNNNAKNKYMLLFVNFIVFLSFLLFCFFMCMKLLQQCLLLPIKKQVWILRFKQVNLKL